MANWRPVASGANQEWDTRLLLRLDPWNCQKIGDFFGWVSTVWTLIIKKKLVPVDYKYIEIIKPQVAKYTGKSNTTDIVTMKVSVGLVLSLLLTVNS